MTKHILTTLCILIASPAFAEEERSWWKFWPSEVQKAVVEETTTTVGNHLFTEGERSILKDYLRKNDTKEAHGDTDDKHGEKHKKAKKQKALPPGLKKKVERGGEIPPGWQKKVARGEVLDEDLYLASKGLPQSILDQLPAKADGTTIRQIDDTIVRVLDATDVILDVLKGNVD